MRGKHNMTEGSVAGHLLRYSIPAILGDKWGKAGKKFIITKLDK